eukprot:TRINITY_DN8819_c0_g1_i2.p1 TRINITY_DN8819_c0_g1~~TRINITY_DN8819_c0_g1_i2.p1  ORF type:complete len:119 (+),score=40.00 TRINITY_DN8819_c0_g1_i2:123-479(+)
MKEHILENPTQNFVVDSIRQPAEVEALSTLEGFSLFAFDADNKLRYERLKSRGRVGDSASFEDFVRDEEREMNNEQEHGQRLRPTMNMAKATVLNNTTLDDFLSAATVAIKEHAGVEL